MSKKNIGPETWRWRLAKAGKTALEFYGISGVHNTRMSQYMNGKIQPNPETVEQVERALKKLGV